MSKAYRDTFGEVIITKQEMKEFTKLNFGHSLTERAHKKECDINQILAKYDKTGLITHISNMEAKFGDMTGMDYRNMLDQTRQIAEEFNKIPAKIRKRFDNDPEQLLTFLSNENNREEAIQLGLIRNDWTPDTDGIGEHIKKPDDRKLIEPQKTDTGEVT